MEFQEGCGQPQEAGSARTRGVSASAGCGVRMARNRRLQVGHIRRFRPNWTVVLLCVFTHLQSAFERVSFVDFLCTP